MGVRQGKQALGPGEGRGQAAPAVGSSYLDAFTQGTHKGYTA